MSEVPQVKIGLLADMADVVYVDEKEIKKFNIEMSSYPAFAKSSRAWDFVTLIKAFKYELERDSPRRQILTRIIQLYNTKLTRFNWEAAMKMAGDSA